MANKMKAVGMFIFCGSATFGAERAGFDVDQVIEITDDIIKQNAFHFVKNRPDIQVTLPSTWENTDYLQTQASKYDLFYANCPCSGLSQINRNASADSKTNVHFYRVFDGIKQLQPKAFVIENAPTLVKLGYPLILEMLNYLGQDYKFTIIRDYAGSHDTGMRRMRTLVVGWRRDIFDNKIPLLHMNKKSQLTIKDVIGDLYDKPLGSVQGHVLHPDRGWAEYEDVLLPLMGPNGTMLLTAIEHYNELKHVFENDRSIKRQIEIAIQKMENNQNIWDKTPCKNADNKPAPSLTSVSEFIHPIHNRQWTLREYARLMGYPDDFEIELEGCETDIIQCLAQGVPAGFMEYVTSETKAALEGEREFIEGSESKILSFQHHTHELFKAFNIDEMMTMTGLDSDKSFSKLEK